MRIILTSSSPFYLKKYSSLLILVWVFLPFNVQSQSDIITNQLWFDVIPHFEIKPKLKYYGDLSYRTSINSYKFRRFVMRPSIRYSLFNGFDLMGGIGLFVTWDEVDYNTVELRPFQGVRFSWPKIWRMNFDHRFWVEERFIWNDEGGFDANLRFRYRLKSKLPINKSILVKNTIYIPFSYEVFANVGPQEVEKFRNSGRAMFGLGYLGDDKWAWELEVIFQRSKSTAVDNLELSDRIFRFKAVYNGWVF